VNANVNFASCFNAVLFHFKAFQVVVKVLFRLNECNHLTRMPPRRAW